MRELRAQFVNALLVILTLAAVVCAGINFRQQNKFRLPEDGVTWAERSHGLEALHVAPGSAAQRAGLRGGDVLRRINGAPVETATDVTRILVRLGAWNKAEYGIHRRGVDIKTSLIVGERVPDTALYYQYVVGLTYLLIGLFVYFRRGSADKARHFYILCLASFVLSTFHYTGKLNNFDKVMYWGNVAAGLLAPTIFLHFCLAFPKPRQWLRGRGRAISIYLPAVFLGAVFFGVASGTLRLSIPSIELRWLLDRVWLAFLAIVYLAGGSLLWLRYRQAKDHIVRQQLKWLRNGALFGILPFAFIYALPYALGAVPGPYMKMAVLSLVIVPLSWAYAVLRYRLMDVDIIFQQGYVYTLATLCVLGLFYGLIFSLGKFEDLSPAAAVILILIAAFAFQPIRSWIQEQLDKYYFYKDRYDYRRTLIEFARELGSEPDLDAMLASVADRLGHTLSVPQVAFFLADEAESRFRLKLVAGSADRSGRRLTTDDDETLDLSFLTAVPKAPYLFFERTQYPLDVVTREWPPSVRETIADLDLTYYVPCSARSRTIAYMGVSRTDKGDFLSSDDVQLLVTLSGYVGIAIENTRLYRSLQRKVEENERLREFNENIVESINVGILASDLEDRVESWNTEMERLTRIPREMALGQPLSALFQTELVEQFTRVREESGIHHVYKFALRPHMTTALVEAEAPGVNGRSQTNRPPPERLPRWCPVMRSGSAG
jgi:PAS domain-containing protein